MWQVFENDKSADSSTYPHIKGRGWDNSKFCTFQQAYTYMRKWLGGLGDHLPEYVDKEDGYCFCYNGYDTVSIRKVSE